MKAITLTQPWATLVAIGAKRIETRDWHSWRLRPGTLLAIHAARGFPLSAQFLCSQEPFRSALLGANLSGFCIHPKTMKVVGLPRGAVVAVCRFDGTHFIEHDWNDQPHFLRDGAWHTVDKREQAFGDYRWGCYMWHLTLSERIEPPIPARGALGVWDWDD